MAAVADFSTTLGSIESGHSDGRCEISVVKDDVAENSDELMQTLSGKPTRLLSAVRHCISDTTAVLTMDSDARVTGARPPADTISDYIPIFRCGSCDEKGPKSYMEDEHICIDDLPHYLGDSVDFPSSGAFYGVFDGHGGTDAASFIRNNILKFIVEDSFFPSCLGEAIKNAFLKADYALADNSSVDTSSGTTALIAVIFGRKLVVANAGDCRAVLGRRGIAIEMSKDHKPNYPSERLRIEKLGGAIYDGYLNGQLSVSRALGDWHMKRSGCPLSAEPELQEMILTEEDEFLIMGCDGLWDVMGSQCAVAMARRELMLHNDPERCSRELVREAMRRNACDNLTVVVICFSPDPPPVTDIAPSRLPRSLSDERVNLVKRELVRGNNMRIRF